MKDNDVVAGFLFGSYARGEVGPMSDVDVAVIFSSKLDFSEQENKIEKIRHSLEKYFGADKADVVNVAKARSPLLRYNILIAEGKRLFSEDPQLLAYFTMKALRDFEDTNTLRQRKAEVVNRFFATAN